MHEEFSLVFSGVVYLFKTNTLKVLFKNIRNIQYISKNNNRKGVQCADKVVYVQ